MTTFRWYLLGIIALFGGYVALEYYRPKPLDWSPSLSSKDKIPYGTYVLYDALPQLLGTDSVENVRLPIFNQLLGSEEPDYDSDDTVATAQHTSPEAVLAQLTHQKATYIFVNQMFTSSGLETKALLRFMERGNNVFIAADNFNNGGHPILADSLGFGAVRADTTSSLQLQPADKTDSVQLHLLAARPGQPTTFRLPASVASHRVILYKNFVHRGATLAADEQGRPVLVRLDVGRGHLYVCSVPLAFGNYLVLRPHTADFAFAALSYLPTGRPAWWDEYQKQGRTGEQSSLRVLMAHPALRAAYYLLCIVGLLFVFVEARRRQRIIPTLKPLPNNTLLFTRTVAGLYQQGRNHSQIAEKKVALFLDYLRTRFHEPTPDLADDTFRERLSQKAGLPRPRVDELVRLINHARTAPVVTDRELLILSRAIRDFKREVQ